jgi:hypothetical protein
MAMHALEKRQLALPGPRPDGYPFGWDLASRAFMTGSLPRSHPSWG